MQWWQYRLPAQFDTTAHQFTFCTTEINPAMYVQSYRCCGMTGIVCWPVQHCSGCFVPPRSIVYALSAIAILSNNGIRSSSSVSAMSSNQDVTGTYNEPQTAGQDTYFLYGHAAGIFTKHNFQVSIYLLYLMSKGLLQGIVLTLFR